MASNAPSGPLVCPICHKVKRTLPHCSFAPEDSGPLALFWPTSTMRIASRRVIANLHDHSTFTRIPRHHAMIISNALTSCSSDHQLRDRAI
jgi:hypothetical protein